MVWVEVGDNVYVTHFGKTCLGHLPSYKALDVTEHARINFAMGLFNRPNSFYISIIHSICPRLYLFIQYRSGVTTVSVPSGEVKWADKFFSYVFIKSLLLPLTFHMVHHSTLHLLWF